MSHKERFKIQVSVVLILEQNNQFLLGQRCNTNWRSGYYCLIGGGLEEGESLTQAMIREAREEIGVEINPADLRFERTLHIQNMNLVCIVFTANTWNGEPTIQEPHKCSDLRWFCLDNLPENIDPHDKNILLTLDRTVFSESIE